MANINLGRLWKSIMRWFSFSIHLSPSNSLVKVTEHWTVIILDWFSIPDAGHWTYHHNISSTSLISTSLSFLFEAILFSLSVVVVYGSVFFLPTVTSEKFPLSSWQRMWLLLRVPSVMQLQSSVRLRPGHSLRCLDVKRFTEWHFPLKVALHRYEECSRNIWGSFFLNYYIEI